MRSSLKLNSNNINEQDCMDRSQISFFVFFIWFTIVTVAVRIALKKQLQQKRRACITKSTPPPGVNLTLNE